jgi:hypothetical protein
MPMSLRIVTVAVVLALVVSVGAAPSGAAGAAKQTRPGAGAVRTTTVVERAPVRDDRSAPVTVLLVGAGAAVGVIVGVIPALMVALLLGYLPPPRRTRRAGSLLVEPPRREPLPELGPARAAPPAPVLVAAAGEPPPEPSRQGQLAILAHARHQSVYDAAYAEQLDRVETLRSAIGGRRGKPSEPPTD